MADREARTLDLAAQAHGVVRLDALLAVGWTADEVRSRVRRGDWRRLLVGVVLVQPDLVWSWSEWNALPIETRVSAARLYHGDDSVFVGSTAGQLLGLTVLPPDGGVVHVRQPPGRQRHQQAGVRLHTLKLAPSDITTTCHGFAVTTVGRTVTDLVLTARRLEAVALLDHVLARGLLTTEQLFELCDQAHGRRGVRRSRPWWELAAVGAQSPLETRIRLVAIDAGLQPDVLQLPVRDHAGVLLGYGDMAWHLRDGRVLIAEADGQGPHSLPAALFHDRRRANEFLGTQQVDIVRFTWRDPDAYIVSTLRRQLSRS
jgi:hypothetical protein